MILFILGVFGGLNSAYEIIGNLLDQDDLGKTQIEATN